MPNANPVLVEVTRGRTVECRHRGALAVVDAEGKLVHSWGDVARPQFARSAIKPVQALPLIETGAADAFGLSQKEIALACASHSGEPVHVDLVQTWLDRIGLSVDDLECGARPPIGEGPAHALIANGICSTPAHDNCSGKHTGFLSTARHMGEPTAGYILADHPVQKRIAKAMGEMGGFDPAKAATGTDGCGIPVIGMSLKKMAWSMARMAAPDSLTPERADAARRIVLAMAAEPHLVAGEGRFDALAIPAGNGAFVTKAGAEGVHVAIVPKLGLGMALKIDDGAKRAADCAAASVLQILGLLDAQGEETLTRFLESPVPNAAGITVGVIRPGAALRS